MKNESRIRAFLFVLLAGTLASGPDAWAKLKVVTTLPSFADIAAKVGGEEIESLSLTQGYQDPHFVDAKPDLVLKLNKADLLIHVGLGLEDGWLPPLLVGSRNGKIQKGADGNLEASSAVTLKDVSQGAVDRSMGDVHPGGNPHFMLDPRNGAKIAWAISEKLSKLDPAKGKEYAKRADAYVKELESRIQSWEKRLKPWAGKPVATYHKSWTYFTSWVGMKEEGTVEPKPGIPPTPEHVVKLVRELKEKKVGLILIEPYYPKGTAEHVAAQAGAKVLVLPTEVRATPEATTYVGVFDRIIALLEGSGK